MKLFLLFTVVISLAVEILRFTALVSPFMAKVIGVVFAVFGFIVTFFFGGDLEGSGVLELTSALLASGVIIILFI